jgi:DNA-binding Lrp family transcriptional regulator
MSSQTKEFEKACRFLVRHLQAPRTADYLACAVGVSRPTIYARIQRLRRLGYKIKTSHVREGERGPKARAFRLLRAPARGKA